MAKLSSTQIFGDLIVDGQIKNLATTETEGVVKLNDTVTSTSVTEAATANAVKQAYDKANHAHPYAATSHGTHVVYGDSTSPLSTTGIPGVATTVSRSDHTHALPTSLPANGGNADTLDGKHATDFATASHTHNYVPVTSNGNITITADLDANATTEYVSIKSGHNELKVISSAGGTVVTQGQDKLLFNNNIVYHAGKKPTPTEIGAAQANHTHNSIVCTDVASVSNYEGLTVTDTNVSSVGYDSNYSQVLNIKSASGTTQIINETEWEEPTLKVRQKYLDYEWGPFYKIYHSGAKPTPEEIGAFQYTEHKDGTSLDTAFETGTHWVFHATGTLPAGYTTDNDFVLQSFRSGITNKSWQIQFLYDMRESRTFTRRQKNGVFEAWTELTSGNFLPLTGGTLTSDLEFSNNEIGSTKGIIGTVGDNDFWRIVGGSTASNSGYLEIATADDGTEPIYVRQYSSGKFITLARTATLLDGSGNTSFPGTVTATAFTGALNGNASTATTLKTARTINGVAFNGSANITIQDSTKLALSGGTLSGALNFANATLNKVGDDAYLGDNNVAGCVCIKGNNASTGLTFIPYSGSVTQTLRIDGSNTMTLNGNFRADAEIQSTSANAFRAAYGNYGFFIRQDGANTYFMFTNSGDPYGGWNNLRPLILSNSTGSVSTGHSFTIGDSNGNVKRTTISTANPSGGTHHDVWIKY